ncbi:MAG TPA: siroheme synthase CysG [Vicinamibacteria bacterium]|nr:siroheme synthase CysG [Vicinamibacteria bacterium]
MLDLRGRSCLVVGGGPVALRKALSLLEQGASVTVVAPEVVPRLETLSREGLLRLEKRCYSAGEAAGFALAFAATDAGEVNRRVSQDAQAAGVWVNVADVPELCSFQVPARVRRGALELAIASGGQAPFAVRRLRQLLERRFGAEWGRWLEAAARFRSRMRRLAMGDAQREAGFDRFFAETVDQASLRARAPSEAQLETWALASARATPDPAPSGKPQAAARGFVSLVGAGPGCPGLLTVRGRERLLQADAVAYDRLAAPALPGDLPPWVELFCVGKEAGRHPVPQEEINALLVRLAGEGKRVVRFKGGDPNVFGRGSEEAEALSAAGVAFEVVPGVTAGTAAPAWIGIPLTHRREAVRVTFLTAHESGQEEAAQMRWDLVAQDPHATLVGYMGVTALPAVVSKLLEGGMDPATPAALIERGTTAAQRSVIATLGALPEEAARAGMRPPAIFVIGPTVGHAERLDWVKRLVLAGERLAVCRLDLVAPLEAAGAEAVPVGIPVMPVTRVILSALPLTGCLVSSPEQLEALEGERSRAVCWCLGRETAERARERGWERVEELAAAADPAAIVRRIAERRLGATPEAPGTGAPPALSPVAIRSTIRGGG